jgi:hypothetical protein
MEKTFTVRNVVQKALFDKEILGQLSDGMWENAVPWDHWKVWSGYPVVVAAEGGVVGRTFGACKDNYDLLRLAKNDIVRDRMILIAKLVLTFGEVMYPLVSKLFDWQGNWRGMPKCSGRSGSTDAEDKLNLRLLELFPTPERLETVRTLTEMQRYTKNDLLADLRDLKAEMKTYLKVSDA